MPTEDQDQDVALPDGIGTSKAMRAAQRHGLAAGYPADLSRSSEPAQGSIGDGTMPIANREAPWKRLAGGK